EPAASDRDRVTDNADEPDEASCEHVRPEDEHERVEADAGPHDDCHAERDRERAVEAERPTELLQFRPRGLFDLPGRASPGVLEAVLGLVTEGVHADEPPRRWRTFVSLGIGSGRGLARS